MATNLSVIPQELKTITQSAAALSAAIARYESVYLSVVVWDA